MKSRAAGVMAAGSIADEGRIPGCLCGILDSNQNLNSLAARADDKAGLGGLDPCNWRIPAITN